MLVIILLVNFLCDNWPSALAVFAVMLAAVVGVNALTRSARQVGSRAIRSIADATGAADVTVPTLPCIPEECAA